MKTVTINIINYPNEALNKKCDKIDNIEVFRKTLHMMKAYVEEEKNEAAGLAMPQIGLNKRAFVARIDGRTEVVINPMMLRPSGGKVSSLEGCLSIPGKTARVKRYKSRKVVYTNLDGHRIKKTLKGFDARVFQHEFDHLEGILITDIAEEVMQKAN